MIKQHLCSAYNVIGDISAWRQTDYGRRKKTSL